MANWVAKTYRALAAPWFFWLIVALFILQAGWLAFSAAYPMAFDENTHYGIIQLHAQQWSPLFLQQPPDSGFAGALTRDPSYLYHYLLSLPYRLLSAVTDSVMAQIIVLRLINIGFFAVALVLFRRLLLRCQVSPATTHTVLLFFVLIPSVPLLAAQVNYDNLVVLATAGALLLAVKLNQTLDTNKKLPVSTMAWLLTLCLLASLVQFIFLPIFAAIVLWFGWRLWRRKGLFGDLGTAWRQATWPQRLLVGVPLVIAFGLFTHMYGYNLVAYHSPIPQCNEVLSNQQCAEHGPWVRNNQALQAKTEVSSNPVSYGASWLYRMFVSSFYTSSGGAGPSAWYLSINPLPVAFGVTILVFAVGIVLSLWYGRRILENHRQLGFLMFVSGVFVLALWLRNYHSYLHFGQKLAINGRYVLPILLIIMVFMALAYQKFLGQRLKLKIGLVVIAIVLLLQGGGITNYLVVSKPAWYWQKSLVISMNRQAQRIVKPFVIIETPLKSVDQYY